MFQWIAEAADYAPTNQNIFFLGARMPEKVPDSAIKFYEDRFVNLWRFADEPARSQQSAKELLGSKLATESRSRKGATRPCGERPLPIQPPYPDAARDS